MVVRFASTCSLDLIVAIFEGCMNMLLDILLNFGITYFASSWQYKS